jgi:hypothetical protein
MKMKFWNTGCGGWAAVNEGTKRDDMSKSHAVFLSVLLAVVIAIAVPISVALWRLLLTQVSGIGMFVYSTLLACVAAPFLYAMFRRMK